MTEIEELKEKVADFSSRLATVETQVDNLTRNLEKLADLHINESLKFADGLNKIFELANDLKGKFEAITKDNTPDIRELYKNYTGDKLKEYFKGLMEEMQNLYFEMDEARKKQFHMLFKYDKFLKELKAKDI